MIGRLVSLLADLVERASWPPPAIAFIHGQGDDAVLRLRPGVSPYPKRASAELVGPIENPAFEESASAWSAEQ